MITLPEAAKNIQEFEGSSLKDRLSDFEQNLKCADKTVWASLEISSSLLESGFALKRIAGQINSIIHAAGILFLLPHILRDDEIILSLSLGAGNTGRAFDLETDQRVAEFKFIHWRGGSEAIRQNSLFKDFYLLAEATTSKERYLYVVGKKYPLKFLNGRRSLRSVMSRNNKLWEEFRERYPNRFDKVKEYYNYRKIFVNLEDVVEIMPDFANILN